VSAQQGNRETPHVENSGQHLCGGRPGQPSGGRRETAELLQAVETVRPALQDFYNSLGDDQRARFNTVGRQLSAAEQ
jgi:hypothetical protein